MKSLKLTTSEGNALGLLRISESAAFLGVSEKSIRRKIKEGNLPYRRFGWLYFLDKNDLVPKRIATRAEILG